MHPHQLVDGAALEEHAPRAFQRRQEAGVGLDRLRVGRRRAVGVVEPLFAHLSDARQRRRARRRVALAVEPLELERHHARPIAARRRQLRQLRERHRLRLRRRHDLGERLLGALGIAEPIAIEVPEIEPAVGRRHAAVAQPALDDGAELARVVLAGVEPLEQEAHRR